MKLDAVLVERTSSKSGKKYICVEVYLTDKVVKKVFLSDAEIELIKIYYNSFDKEVNDIVR